MGFCSREVRSLTAGRPGTDDPIAGGVARSAGLSTTFASPDEAKTIVSLCFFLPSTVALSRPDAEPAGAGGPWPGRGGAFLPETFCDDDVGDGGRFGVVASLDPEVGTEDIAGGGTEAALLGAAGATPPRAASFERTAVMGMSSGAFFTTKRTRASGSTAR